MIGGSDLAFIPDRSRSTFRICPPLNLTLTVCKYSTYRFAKYDQLTNLTLTISDQALSQPKLLK